MNPCKYSTEPITKITRKSQASQKQSKKGTKSTDKNKNSREFNKKIVKYKSNAQKSTEKRNVTIQNKVVAKSKNFIAIRKSARTKK